MFIKKGAMHIEYKNKLQYRICFKLYWKLNDFVGKKSFAQILQEHTIIEQGSAIVHASWLRGGTIWI